MARLVCKASVGAAGGFWFVGELRDDNRVYFKRRDGSVIDAQNSRDWKPVPADISVKAGDILQRW
jgi:hypothetical protein